MINWGLVATLKAPARDILSFAAYHIEQGAHRLFLYLDAPCPGALPHLKAHPKIRVIETDDAYWLKRQGRTPHKHQVRQSLNANRAYRRQAKDIDWLIHIDVDEFLYSDGAISAQLDALPEQTFCARVRPLEALAGPSTGAERRFKARIPKHSEPAKIAARLYPTFGSYLKEGFVSHTQGKLFVRTKREKVHLRIHNVFVDNVENPDTTELTQSDLCHLHARDWEQWLAHYRYRVQKGSYRASLRPAQSFEKGGVTLHTLLTAIEADEGEAGLRHFFEETCADSEPHRAALEAEGLLRRRNLPLDTVLHRHFPDYA